MISSIASIVVWRQLQPPSPLQPLTDDFSLIDVTVINPSQNRLEHQMVVVHEGFIKRLSNVIDPEAPEPLKQYRRHFVLPGLVDLHTHLPPDNLLRLSAHSLLLYLAHGVTIIREAGDVDGTAVPAARRAEGSGYAGPRIFACGPFLVGGAPRWRNTRVLHSPRDAEAIVRELKLAGFDCIKSYDDLTVAEIDAVLDAARNSGLPVIGHVPTAVAYEDSNVSDVQHLHGVVPPAALDPNDPMSRMVDWETVDSARMDAFVRSTVERGIAHTPTLVTTRQLLLYADYAEAIRQPYALLMPRLYRDVVWSPTEGLPLARRMDPTTLVRLRSAFEKKKEVVRRLFAAGAQLHLGTDVLQPLVVPGASLQEEMRLFHECGVPLDHLWAMATVQAADALRQPELERLRYGAPADMLIFREDPTRRLEALDSLEAVVVGGKLYRQEDLQEGLRQYQGHFDSFVFDQVSMAATRRVLRRSILSSTDRH